MFFMSEVPLYRCILEWQEASDKEERSAFGGEGSHARCRVEGSENRSRGEGSMLRLGSLSLRPPRSPNNLGVRVCEGVWFRVRSSRFGVWG